ncbi:chondroitin AC/alginate lyase [Dactylonectria estremocensis]|uniref:Chondroitin AC/alginate lyase n=1 Tax=Dactylonectria estremocensis TaxID=1079267 RepID=A0A9P9F1X4_9HYPO|nr:chondroitin AC/alginate lyase [Dactylonectria estremocensis]
MEFCRFLFFSSLWLVPAVTAFSHPGLLVTDQDISRATKKIAAKQDPWLSSWDKLTSLEFSSASYTNGAVADVSRATNGELLWHDAAAAFNLALRWKISGNDTYADTAVAVLVAWAEELQTISGGDEGYLMAGLQGYQLANAAELLRDYAPFAEDGLSTVTSMLTTIFLPMNLDFLNQVLGSQHNVLHFFANWELSNIASALAIGVLTDNQTTWDFAVDYFKNGVGNGAINHAITNIVEEPDTGNPLGQGQESGRDQGHSALDFQLLGVIGQQAWNQGEDLFSYNNSRILLGAEYFARYNLGHDVPFEPYTNGIVSYSTISEASRGAIRPAWELLYAHYVQLKGLDAPWTTEYLNNTLEYFGGFEGGAGSWGEGSGHYDGFGWGSLLHHLDESDVADLTSTTSTAASSTKAASTKTTSAGATSTDSSVSSGASSTQVASDAAVSTITPSSNISSSLPTTVADVPTSTAVLATSTDSSESALITSTQSATLSSGGSRTGKNGKPCRARRL